eukprot:362587-Chlamydomonas_euryale.AAC.3
MGLSAVSWHVLLGVNSTGSLRRSHGVSAWVLFPCARVTCMRGCDCVRGCDCLRVCDCVHGSEVIACVSVTAYVGVTAFVTAY